MAERFPRLLGDIGGTHARWAWQAAPGAPVAEIDVAPCDEHASLQDAARDYLRRRGLPPPRQACIGIATPVTGDVVRMTNHPWTFSIEAVRQAMGWDRFLVLNDFAALALSLPALESGDLRALGGPPRPPDPDAPRALIGPGTGLGVSALVRCDGHWRALAGEGGHVTLAATDDDEADVLARLRRRFGHVSAERVLSGAGLVHLYETCAERAGQPPAPASPADVGQWARGGSDAAATGAMRLFAGFLGSVAGNLALTLGARGGVYVGGGVVPRLGPAFDTAHFRRCFVAKGRFAAYLAAVPTWLITAPTPALLGAARALDAASGAAGPAG